MGGGHGAPAGRWLWQRRLSPGRRAAGPAPGIEAARPADLAALVALDRACFGRRAWPPAAWVEAVTEPGWMTLVVRAAAGPVAAAVIVPAGPVAHLASLGVHPEHRRHGLGAAIVRDVVARARGGGARFVALEVDVANRGARRLYRREGFGVVRRFREDGRWRVEMHRRLGGNRGG